MTTVNGCEVWHYGSAKNGGSPHRAEQSRCQLPYDLALINT